eukprot:RCo040774
MDGSKPPTHALSLVSPQAFSDSRASLPSLTGTAEWLGCMCLGIAYNLHMHTEVIGDPQKEGKRGSVLGVDLWLFSWWQVRARGPFSLLFWGIALCWAVVGP